MTLAAKTAGLSAASPRLRQRDLLRRRRWRPAAERIPPSGCRSGAVRARPCRPGLAAAGEALSSRGGALLLVGGALIGVPHGSSDFVVAHRLMRPALGWRWLPVFLAGYLALVGATHGGLVALPLATLLGFLAISGLHFGWGDMRGRAPPARPASPSRCGPRRRSCRSS